MGCSWKVYLALLCVVNSLCIQVCFTQTTDAGTAQTTGSSGGTTGGVTATTEPGVTTTESVSFGATVSISNATASEAGTDTMNATVATTEGAGTTAGSSEIVTDGQGSTKEVADGGTTGPRPDPLNTTESSAGVNVGMLKFYGHWSGLMMVTILKVMSF